MPTISCRARPVVTVMGHVDHGKTSLLDALRKTDVVARRSRRHHAAYRRLSGDACHRARRSPSSIRRATPRSPPCARAAPRSPISSCWWLRPMTASCRRRSKPSHTPRPRKVPIIVAINKIDKGDANPTRVKTELLQHEIQVEELGGDMLAVEVSAIKGTGLDKLEEAILLQSEVLDLQGQSQAPRRRRGDRSQARQGPRPGRDRARAARHAEARRPRRRRRRMGPRARARQRPRRDRGTGAARRAGRTSRSLRRAGGRRRIRRRRIRSARPRSHRISRPQAPRDRVRRRSRASRSISC